MICILWFMKKALIYLWLCFVLLVQTIPAISQELRTDSRTLYVHKITLYDKFGDRIDQTDQFYARPYSPAVTCGKCHNIDEISKGWHFNALDPETNPGRKGEPWIWMDANLRTQLPLSYRIWPGTYRPEDVGIDAWQFTKKFGRHLPGGIPKIPVTTDESIRNNQRWHITGKLEIDCLICHSADPSYNAYEWSKQIEKENFNWAPSAAAGLATILGDTKSLPKDFDPEFPEFSLDAEPPTTRYNATKFEGESQAFFDITRYPADQRCYFCHTINQSDEQSQTQFQRDDDIHLRAGMNCSDCHRHGLDHRVTRGYEGESKHSGNPVLETLTCRSCHIGNKELEHSQLFGGRLGAPVAQHKGMPIIHFEKLSCTACHSGPWPKEQAGRIQTAMAHSLGLADDHRSLDDPPRIVEPIFVEQDDGVIMPHRMFWPAFWGIKKDGVVNPLPLDQAQRLVSRILKVPNTEARKYPGGWKSITTSQIQQALERIQTSLNEEEKAVYITEGVLYEVIEDTVTAEEHEAAQPYSWPFAHDVRPAGLSLGVRGCGDCHSSESPFYFAAVAASDSAAVKRMADFQNKDIAMIRLFNFSFKFRPWLKVLLIATCVIFAVVLFVYGFRVLDRFFK